MCVSCVCDVSCVCSAVAAAKKGSARAPRSRGWRAKLSSQTAATAPNCANKAARSTATTPLIGSSSSANESAQAAALGKTSARALLASKMRASQVCGQRGRACGACQTSKRGTRVVRAVCDLLARAAGWLRLKRQPNSSRFESQHSKEPPRVWESAHEHFLGRAGASQMLVVSSARVLGLETGSHHLCGARLLHL